MQPDDPLQGTMAGLAAHGKGGTADAKCDKVCDTTASGPLALCQEETVQQGCQDLSCALVFLSYFIYSQGAELRTILSDPEQCGDLHRYLKSQCSAENLLFWEAVESFRTFTRAAHDELGVSLGAECECKVPTSFEYMVSVSGTRHLSL